MWHLVYENGRQLEQRFSGSIATEEDFVKFVAILRHEVNKGTKVQAELWEETHPKEKGSTVAPKSTSKAPQ